jgi:hypothetical protein
MLRQGLLQAFTNQPTQGSGLFGATVPGIGQTKARHGI